jgi:ABC-2 type transport system ATP-binding protein
MLEQRGAAVVRAQDLGKSFGAVEVVKGLDLAIDAGTIVGLIGPSGSGKTTTVRLLTGIYEPTTGTASIGGTESTALSTRQRQRLGYLPQLSALFPDLSVWENLNFHASMYGVRLRRRRWLHQLLDWVELDEHRTKRVNQISAGMQRRLSLAAAFVHDPAVVFLDEPTAGIDPILRARFWERFRELRDQGRTIVVTTQYVGEATYCDLVGVLSDGELLMVSTPEQLRRAAYGGDVLDLEVARRVDASELAAVTTLEHVVAAPWEESPRQWRIVVDDDDAAIGPLEEALRAKGIPVIELARHEVDYDEAFVRVIERHRRLVGDGTVSRR